MQVDGEAFGVNGPAHRQPIARSTESPLNGGVPITSICTPRLLVRPLAAEHAETFAGYRNDPETCRYQGWDLPYTVEDARRLIESQPIARWPVPGQWVQLAIEQLDRAVEDPAAADPTAADPTATDPAAAGPTAAADCCGERRRLIGDLAVGLSADGVTADIGYTLAPDCRGRGLATEAVGAVLDHLRHSGVRLVRASVDPANARSIRLLERLAFVHVGRTEHSALVRGEWVDDDHYERDLV